MKNFSKFIGAVAVILVLITSSAALQAFATTHTLQFVQTPVVSLYASQSASAITMTITPVPTDLAGNVLTMSSFGSGPTLTVDPGILGAEEIETFTSFTNNGNNTATLGGITRGLQSVYPYGTGTGVTHGAGATVVFSNNPQLYNRLASWENDGSITGVWSFTTQPVYATAQTFTNSLSLINKAYADALSIVGAPTSTFNGMGVVWLATNAQIAAGTASSTSGAPLVIPAKAASSTYNGATVFQGEIPALNSSFRIDPNFIATSSGNNYNWAGIHAFSGTTTVSGTGGFLSTASTTLTATTSIAASNVNSAPLKLNGVSYAFPSTQGAAGTTFVNNGSGVLTSSKPPAARYMYASTTASSVVISGSVISTALNIPASTLTASSSVTIDGDILCTDAGTNGNCEIQVIDASSNVYADVSITPGTSRACQQPFHIVVASNNSTSAQVSIYTGACYVTGAATWIDSSAVSSSAVNWSNAVGLSLKVFNSFGAGGTVSLKGFIMTVNP